MMDSFNETVGHDWCAFDINQDSVSAPELVPQSPFRHRVKVKHHQRHLMIRLVERQRQRRNRNRVCVLKTAIRRRYKYPQMIVDVVDVEQDEVRGKPVALSHHSSNRDARVSTQSAYSFIIESDD